VTGLPPAETLAAHLEWAEGSWLGFVFADHEGAVRSLAAQAAGGHAGARTVRPTTPQQLREGVPRLLEGPQASLTWVVACFDEAPPAEGEPPGPWWEASDWFLMRANERRQPLLDHLRGGLLVALPTAYRSRVPMAAPDLWSVRALVLDLPGAAPPTPTVPPVDRRIDVVMRRLAFQQRMRTDPWHACVQTQVVADRDRLLARVTAELPRLVVRPQPEGLWIGVEPGEPSPSIAVDLDSPLPPVGTHALPFPDVADALRDPLSAVDATLRTAAATWSQGWASETLELAERALSPVPGAVAGPDDDRRRATALELAARSRRELGDRATALDDLDEAVSLRRRLTALHGDDGPQRRRELARALSLRGQLLLEGPDPARARPDLEDALALRVELAQWSDDPENLAERALAHSLMADARVALAKGPEDLRAAEAACREALALRRRIVEAVDAPRHRRQLGLAWGRLARVLARQLHLREAEQAWMEAVATAADVAARADLPVHTVEESVARTQLAEVRWRRGDREGARREVELAIAQRRRLLADDPANARWAERLAVALGQGAQQALDDGDSDRALGWAEEAVTVGEQIVSATPSQLRGLALAHLRLGDVHAAARRDDDAKRSWGRARGLLPSLEAVSPSRADQVREALSLRG